MDFVFEGSWAREIAQLSDLVTQRKGEEEGEEGGGAHSESSFDTEDGDGEDFSSDSDSGRPDREKASPSVHGPPSLCLKASLL